MKAEVEDCHICGCKTDDFQWCESCGNPVCFNCYSFVDGKLKCSDCAASLGGLEVREG